EDGIRCFHVTGVQTCALPIFGTSEHVAAADDDSYLNALGDSFSDRLGDIADNLGRDAQLFFACERLPRQLEHHALPSTVAPGHTVLSLVVRHGDRPPSGSPVVVLREPAGFPGGSHTVQI